jgi:hypothetical protein
MCKCTASLLQPSPNEVQARPGYDDSLNTLMPVLPNRPGCFDSNLLVCDLKKIEFAAIQAAAAVADLGSKGPCIRTMPPPQMRSVQPNPLPVLLHTPPLMGKHLPSRLPPRICLPDYTRTERQLPVWVHARQSAHQYLKVYSFALTPLPSSCQNFVLNSLGIAALINRSLANQQFEASFSVCHIHTSMESPLLNQAPSYTGWHRFHRTCIVFKQAKLNQSNTNKSSVEKGTGSVVWLKRYAVKILDLASETIE